MAVGLREANLMPTLAVTDITKARDFYGRVLGLELVDTGIEDENDALFQTGDGSFLYLYERASASGSTATACSFSVRNVEAVVEELRANGVQFEDYDLPEMNLKTENGIARTEDGMNSAWFKDPWGNILAVDNFMSVLARKGRSPWQSPASTETHPH